MDLKKLRKALGLAADAGEEKVLAAATALAKAVSDVAKAIGAEDGAAPDAVATAAAAKVTAAKAAVDGLAGTAEALGLAKDATADDVKAAAATAVATAKANPDGDPDPKAFVPRAQYDALAKRVTNLEDGHSEASAKAAVDAAVKAGKVAPATREWALAYARKDGAGFAAFVQGAPVIVKPGAIDDVTDPGTRSDDDPLTEQELAVCRATGVTEQQFRESRTALGKRSRAA